MWQTFYGLYLYKELTQEIANNIKGKFYILITDRYKKNILNRLYIDKQYYLIPEKLNKLFVSTYIYKWVNIDNNWYRYCIKGTCKDYILDFDKQLLIHISEIDNKKLLDIIIK